MTLNPIQKRIELAVGQSCLWWSTLEHIVHDLCLHLASCLSLDFEETVNRVTLHMALSNMDLRERIATAKAYASQAPTANASFYNRTEKLLNRLDNELRPERNRFVHDLWMIDGETVEQFKAGTVVSRPQSHKLELSIGTAKPLKVEEVEAFAKALEQMFHDLVAIDGETASMCAELERLVALRRSVRGESENSFRRETPGQDTP